MKKCPFTLSLSFPAESFQTFASLKTETFRKFGKCMEAVRSVSGEEGEATSASGEDHERAKILKSSKFAFSASTLVELK
jgi:hypothetical protein